MDSFFSFLAELLANVVNHIYDDIRHQQIQRRSDAEQISVETLPRNSIQDTRKFLVKNDGDKPISRVIVEWRRVGQEHQNDRFDRTGYYREIGGKNSHIFEQENTRGTPLPHNKPESCVLFNLDGRWWRVTEEHAVQRLRKPPVDAFAKKRREVA